MIGRLVDKKEAVFLLKIELPAILWFVLRRKEFGMGDKEWNHLLLKETILLPTANGHNQDKFAR